MCIACNGAPGESGAPFYSYHRIRDSGSCRYDGPTLSRARAHTTAPDSWASSMICRSFPPT